MTIDARPASPVVFDPFAPGFHDDPFSLYRRLREEDPVHWSPLNVWILSRHADISTVLRDTARFGNADPYFGEVPGQDPAVKEMSASLNQMLGVLLPFMDAPGHSRIRSLIAQAFTPRRAEQLRDQIGAWVDGLLDELDPGEVVDLVPALATPLPVMVICELLGVPDGDRALAGSWAADIAPLLDPMQTAETLGSGLAAFSSAMAYFSELVAGRRADLRDDLLSALITAEEAGDALGTDELVLTLFLLLLGGYETTRSLIGNGTLALLRHPGELRRLRADPTLARPAVEEMLRYDPPIHMASAPRRVLEDVPMGGRVLRRGDSVRLLLASANRDPDVFDDPDRFDLGRADHRHLAFGAGPHFCPGAALARTEGQVAVTALVQRFPALALVDDEPRWSPRVAVRSLESLRVRLG